MFKRSLLVLVLGLLSASAFAKAVPYDIDANHTQINFSYRHFGFSDITDRFMQVSGVFNFDPAEPTKSSISVIIPMAGLSTGVPKLDEHLKSPDFFDAEKFPVATFKSSKVESAGSGRLKVNGDLSIHGVTRPVVLDVIVNKIGEHPMSKLPSAGFDASVTLKRSDFGVGNYAPGVSDEVKLQITMEAHQVKS
jgi:polyisoprenoid-binding protein YceI